MGIPSLAQLALTGVISLIAFLGYGPQYLFHYTQPGPLHQGQSLIFNALLLCTWCCYARACFTDPGHVPRNWESDGFIDQGAGREGASQHGGTRWCRKCENQKPPRAHHCKVCERYVLDNKRYRLLIESSDRESRCIPKMDHHCPWTINCVSHRTFPHFFRFLFYSVMAMCHLEYLLYIRLAVLFRHRSLPSVRLFFSYLYDNRLLLFSLVKPRPSSTPT